MTVEYEIQGLFNQSGDLSPRDDWETVDTVDGRDNARQSLATYRDNDPEHQYRMRRTPSEG